MTHKTKIISISPRIIVLFKILDSEFELILQENDKRSGDQLLAQNSLKDNIKFLDSLLEIDFYSLTIIFSPRLFLDITIFFIFPLDKIGNSLIVKAKP